MAKSPEVVISTQISDKLTADSDSDDLEMEQLPVPLPADVMLNDWGLDLADPNQQPPEPWLDPEEVD